MRDLPLTKNGTNQAIQGMNMIKVVKSLCLEVHVDVLLYVLKTNA